MQVYPCTKCIGDKYYSSEENPGKSKALKELINSFNCYLYLRYKKAPWITNIDQYKQSISKIYLSLLLPSKKQVASTLLYSTQDCYLGTSTSCTDSCFGFFELWVL